jgi:hypothetical protein
MWTTRDGYRLRLTHGGLHRVLARTPPDGLVRLARGELNGDPSGNVVRSIARITRTTHLAERGPTDDGLALFKGPGFEILVQATGPGRADILQLRPRSEEEIYAATDPRSRRGNRRVRGARVRIAWTQTKLTVAGRARGGGVYIVTRRTLPVYVGETASFAARWGGRLTVLGHLGLLSPQPTCACLTEIDVWLGTIQETTRSGARAADIRRDVEHVLVRQLRPPNLQVPNIQIVNRSPIAQLIAAPAGLEITNSDPRPVGLPRTITVAPGAGFELEAS